MDGYENISWKIYSKMYLSKLLSVVIKGYPKKAEFKSKFLILSRNEIVILKNCFSFLD